MVFILIANFIIGFFAHKARPWTKEFDERTGSLLRYTIGLVMFIPLSALAFVMNFKRQKDKCTPLAVFECHLLSGVLTAVTLGGGVVTGYLLDKEKI